MEILKILQKSADELIPEDLDFFETELATGGNYSAAYQEQCRYKIRQIRKWMVDREKDDEPKDNIPSGDTSKDNSNIFAQCISKTSNNEMMELSPVEQIRVDLRMIRGKSDYKSAFKEYVKNSLIIDADFLDKNFAIFDSWEMDAIVSAKQLGEDFLEKYFGAINPDKIARYQLFSEKFFMNHFAQMNPNIVLERGKNEWRKKENRSKQLDVFLRLKGVKE